MSTKPVGVTPWSYVVRDSTPSVANPHAASTTMTLPSSGLRRRSRHVPRTARGADGAPACPTLHPPATSDSQSANGNAARPTGACRVLMIGDVIGYPGGWPSRRSCRPSATSGHRLRHRERRESRGRHGPHDVTADAPLRPRRRRDHLGNHIWDKNEIYPALESNDRILRPLNYGTTGVPGRGWGVYHALDGSELAVINLQGRTYMQPIENPFLEADRLLEEAGEPLPPIRLVDFHCEITSEKNALGVHLDGRVSPSSGRTPTYPPRTTGSCPAEPPTRATSG